MASTSFATTDEATPATTILSDALALYQGGHQATDIVGRLYDERATFEDGVLRVTGSPAIAAQFSALSSLFSSVVITARCPPAITYAGDGGGGDRDRSATRAGVGGGGQPPPTRIVQPTTQAFTLWGALPATVTLEVDICLTCDPATGRIVAHHDVWRGVTGLPAFLRVRRLPLVCPPGPLRSLNGRITTALLRAAGYGTAGTEGPAGAATHTGHTHQE